MKHALAVVVALAALACGGFAAADVGVSGDDGGVMQPGQSFEISVSDAISSIPNGPPAGLCGPIGEQDASGWFSVGPLSGSSGGSRGTLSVSCTPITDSNGEWHYSGSMTLTVPADVGSSMWVSVAVQEIVPTEAQGGTWTNNYSFNRTYSIAVPTTTAGDTTAPTSTATPVATTPATTTATTTTTAAPTTTVAATTTITATRTTVGATTTTAARTTAATTTTTAPSTTVAVVPPTAATTTAVTTSSTSTTTSGSATTKAPHADQPAAAKLHAPVAVSVHAGQKTAVVSVTSNDRSREQTLCWRLVGTRRQTCAAARGAWTIHVPGRSGKVELVLKRGGATVARRTIRLVRR